MKRQEKNDKRSRIKGTATVEGGDAKKEKYRLLTERNTDRRSKAGLR